MINIIFAALTGIALESWRLFVEMAPYLFLGFVIAGLLHVYIPERQILKYLGNSAGKIRSALHATLLGIPIPLCSCGVVPTALSLQKKGATKGATLSFIGGIKAHQGEQRIPFSKEKLQNENNTQEH